MNVVTTADSNYFHCVRVLAENVRKHYGKDLIIYDVGFTGPQRDELASKATVLRIAIDPSVDPKGRAWLSPNGHPSTRATHKPFCVRHYFQNHHQPMILVDADCLFNRRVQEEGFDVGVTYNPPKRSKKMHYYNGVINSGVIFFNTPARELVNLWIQECYKPDTTDQKALSDILSETVDWKNYKKAQYWRDLRIKIFECRKYNDYHLRRNSAIIHFINSKHRKDIYEKLLVGYEQGRNIREMFRQIKRGRKPRRRRLWEGLSRFFTRRRP